MPGPTGSPRARRSRGPPRDDRTHVVRRRPGDLRHTGGSAESCCLPALTRFTGSDCTGPGRHLTDASARVRLSSPPGDVRERPNRHAWKACVGKLTVGSNPTVSATDAPAPTGRVCRVRPGTGCPSRLVPAVPLPARDPDHETWMRAALAQARRGRRPRRRADRRGRRPPRRPTAAPHVVAARHNERELTGDPTAHAEVLALRDAAAALGPLAAGRLHDGRHPRALPDVRRRRCGRRGSARVVFGAENTDAGALGTLYHLGQDPRLNHEFPVRAQVLGDESRRLLRRVLRRPTLIGGPLPGPARPSWTRDGREDCGHDHERDTGRRLHLHRGPTMAR